MGLQKAGLWLTLAVGIQFSLMLTPPVQLSAQHLGCLFR